MKSSRMKKILAVILCLTLGLSTNMMTMAESTNSPAVQSVQEEQQTDASVTTDGVEVLAETEQTVTETPTPTATPEPETTPEATATPTPETTPEATATPTPEATPEVTATPTPTEATETQEPTLEVTLTPETTPGADEIQDEATETSNDADSNSNSYSEQEAANEERSYSERQQFISDVNEIAQLLYGESADYNRITEDSVQGRYNMLSDGEKNRLEQLIENAEASEEKLNENDRWNRDVRTAITKLNIVIQYTGIIDLNGSRISIASYNTMLQQMENDLETRTENTDGSINIPINNWKRSSEYAEVNKVSGSTYYDWAWSAGSRLDLDITDEHEVWDGSRLDTNNQVSHDAKKEPYLKSNQITVSQDTLYDSATWDFEGSSEAALHRFQGIFDITDLDPNEYLFTIEPVAMGENQIYINDDMFVFIHPVNENGAPLVEINDNNFTDYLAFWTGTIYQNGSASAGNVTEYRGIPGAKATHGDKAGLGILTDGWYTEATKDNAGYLIQSLYNSSNGAYTKFAVDVFVDDYAGSGGMYRLKLTADQVTRHPIEFYKVDQNNSPLNGAEFTLQEKETGGTRYRGISDSSGKVTIEVAAGTYTMWESKVPENCEEVDENQTWTVVVQEDGDFTITCDNGHSNLKHEGDKYYISNKSTASGTLTFYKTDTEGQPINKNATFALYRDEGLTDLVAERTAAGTFTFANLPTGTYYLKEKQAPEGYHLSDETYIVTVRVGNNGNAEVTLTTKDGTPVTDNKIVNKSDEEYYSENINSTKDAELIDWDERTYKLTLTADSLAQESTPGHTKAIDVVLVLDTSGSMGETTSTRGKTGITSFNKLNRRTTYYFEQNGTEYEVTYDRGWKYREKITNDPYERLSDFSDYEYFMYYRFSNGRMTRMDALKEAANVFITTLAETSPNSRVGIVTYSSSSNKEKEVTSVSDKSLYSAINGLNASGSTYPSSAITQAGNMLNGEDNEKHVIFLTDGDCGYSAGDHDEDEEQRCISAASTLKKNKIQIHAIRFATTGASYLSQIVTDTDKNGVPLVYSADDVDDLIESFNLIIEGSLGGMAITGATIKDVIDEHFIVTDKDGKPIEVGEDGYQLSYDNNGTPITGTLYEDENGNQYIIWNDQTIGVKDLESGTGGWKVELYIKAKDDYIGGNGVPTNGAGSGIYLGDDDNPVEEFPVPYVNVKVELTVNNHEETIFLGEAVPTDLTIVNQLFDVNSYCQKYTDVTSNDFTLTWYKDASCMQLVTLEEMEQVFPENDVNYYLKVTYDAGEPQGNSTENCKGYLNGSSGSYKVAAVNSADSSKLYGIYTIKVIKGQIDITKTISGNINRNLEGNPIFTFMIEYYAPTTEDIESANPAAVYYRTIEFDDDDSSKSAEELSDLPKGIYKVTELATQKFETTEVSGSGCNASVDEREKTITFYIGMKNETSSETDIHATNGSAIFTNNKTGPSTNTDTDVVVNRFVYDETEDKWIIKQIWNPGQDQDETDPATEANQSGYEQ